MSLWRIPVDRELSERARWLTRARLVTLLAMALLIGVATLLLRDVLPVIALWWTWAAALLYGLVFHVITVRVVGETAPAETYVLLVSAQLLCDVLALTALLHFSGGIENPLSVFYLVLVVVGSSLLHRRSSLFHAAFASLAWVVLILLEAWGILPHHNLAGFRSPLRYHQVAHLWSYSLVMLAANICVSLLASGIVERARAGEAELLEAQRTCAARLEGLEALTAELQRIDEQRSLFMRVVTHELRAPVAAIKSLLQLILTGYVPPDRQLEFIAKAEARANEQLDIIGDLLDLSHIRQGVRQPQPDACHVDLILADVMDMLQPRFAEEGIEATCEVQPGLPQVLASQEHLKQVWTNLISNAIKYNRPNGRIAVHLALEGGLVQGSVSDTGIGIAREDQQHLFQDFYRTEEARRHSRQGTGLGLAIVRAIVERYGGRVWCESVLGEGSTFCFTLPPMPARS
ncbi:MAG: sensor histidine kinase [Anaerolineae bacterium]|jgi:signal transduction histidine kinase